MGRERLVSSAVEESDSMESLVVVGCVSVHSTFNAVLSIYLRKGTNRFAQFLGNNNLTSNANFDLETDTTLKFGTSVNSLFI